MKHNVLLILFVYFISINYTIAQGIELKLGTAFYNTYEINNVHHPAPYYYDAKYDINTGLIISLAGYYPLSEKFELVGDLRIRNLTGTADSIYAGYSPFDSSNVFKSWDFKFVNFDLILKARYNLVNNLNFRIIPFLGIGYSTNLSYERTFIQTKVALTTPDLPIILIEEPSNNNTGFLMSLGTNIYYKFMMIEFGVDLGLFKTHIYEAGNVKLLNTSILIGINL